MSPSALKVCAKGAIMKWHTSSQFDVSHGGTLRSGIGFALGSGLLFSLVALAPASAGTATAVRAAAPVPTSLTGPAAASGAGGQTDVFYRNPTDGQLTHRKYQPSALAAWSGAEFLGGILSSQPAVASWASGRYDVVARQDSGVWHRAYSGGWRAWESLGGVATSPPAIAASSTGRLDAFVRGSNNALYTKSFVPGTGWSGWSSLGGVLTSGPAAVVATGGRVEVVVRGGDGAVWRRTRTSAWSRWSSVGGSIVGEPGIAASGDGGLDVFGRGPTNVLNTRHFSAAGAASAWTSLGGVLSSGPSATTPQVNVVAVFVRGSDGRFFYRQRPTGAPWSGWRAVDPAQAFRGLGAWVDTLDYQALAPATAVADMRARGVRTLYLSTARYNSGGDILFPTQVAEWLAAAHGAGIRVVGWYVPDYADLTRDVRRALAVSLYVSPTGHRFDALGLDIEYPLNPSDANAWNAAVANHLARVRAGTMLPIAAIPLPPVLMRGWPDPDRWATFPWATIGRLADGMLPQSYWTSFTPANRCAAGDPQYCAYRYTRDNVLLSRQLTRLPVHAVGGVGDTTTLTQLSDYARAARETGSIGVSLYDYRTTTAAMWPILQ
jgi:hypothetical protein